MPVRTRVLLMRERCHGCAAGNPIRPTGRGMFRRCEAMPIEGHCLRPSAASRTLLCFAALASSACSALDARPLVDIDVIDRDTGEWLPGGACPRQRLIPATRAIAIRVRLTNTTGERLVVLSVDG